MWLYCYVPIAPLTIGLLSEALRCYHKTKWLISHAIYQGLHIYFSTSALCVPGMFFKIKQKILQCHVGVLRKWALSLWYVTLGWKLVIWPIVIMTFEKNSFWKFAGSGSYPARDLSISLLNCQEHNKKMSFHLSNIYQLGLGDSPRL